MQTKKNARDYNPSDICPPVTCISPLIPVLISIVDAHRIFRSLISLIFFLLCFQQPWRQQLVDQIA